MKKSEINQKSNLLFSEVTKLLLTTFFIFAVSNIIAAKNFENEKNLDIEISLTMKNITLREALYQLQNNSKFKFSYNSKLDKLQYKVSIEACGKTLRYILHKLLKPLNLSYKVISNHIVLQNITCCDSVPSAI